MFNKLFGASHEYFTIEPTSSKCLRYIVTDPISLSYLRSTTWSTKQGTSLVNVQITLNIKNNNINSCGITILLSDTREKLYDSVYN